MGGVVGQLSYLYCRSGCQASVVASHLTFHPPLPSFYKFKYNEETATYSIIFTPQANAVKWPKENMMVELLRTKTKTTIPLVCLKHKNARFTIIYSHGNATDIGAMFFMYAMICTACEVNVVGYDYTGYGASMDGGVAPTEKQTYRDIERVYDWCLETRLVKDHAKETLLYGQSVGSGPSCYLASTQPVAGLILHSPILSGIRVLTASRMLACFDIYPNINRIKKVKAPVFVIHGDHDEEVGFHHGYDLYCSVSAAFQTEPWWVHERGHNDVLKGNEHEFFRRMLSYLDTVKKHQDPSEPTVQAGTAKKEPVQAAVESSDEIRRSSTVKALTSPTEAELRQGTKRSSSSMIGDQVESNEILLNMDLTAPQRM